MRNCRILLLVIIQICLTKTVLSQDVILKKDNTTVLSKVLEITSTEIKYKKWNNQDGPTYSISRSEVTSINYQNGEVDRFTDNTTITPVPQQTVNQPQPQVQVPQTPSQADPEKPKSRYARGRVQFSLNGGVAIPMEDFGVTDNNSLCAAFSFGGDEFDRGNGAAKTGFNASMKLHIPVYKHDKDFISIPLKFNVMYNSLTDPAKRLYRELCQAIGYSLNEQYGSNAYQLQVTKYSNYMNYSFMGGVDYTHYFSKSFGLFAEANIGLNLAHITSSNMNNLLGGSLVYVDYNNYIQYYSRDGLEVRYKMKTNFVYEIGGGLFLFNHLSIGIFYTGYSPFQVSPVLREYSNSTSYTFDNGSSEVSMETTAPKLKVSALSIQLGVHF